MGHDITAFTRSGDKIRGPRFAIYWWPHYHYLEAEHHNHGISGDGQDEEMTPERLQRAAQRVENDLSIEREALREVEDWLRAFQAKASDGLSKLTACQADPEGEWTFVPLQEIFAPLSCVDEDDEEEPKDEGVLAVQDLRSCKETIKVYEELRGFFNRCIAEDVVRIKFW